MSRCPYCSFDPTNLNDFCNEHRPKVRETPAPPPKDCFLSADVVPRICNLGTFGCAVTHVPKDAAESPAPQGWQPIATAPKDGRLLILHRGCLAYGYFFRGNDGSSGWITNKIGRNSEDMSIEPPTHWMPMPDPPGGTDRSSRVSGEEKDAARDWPDEDFNHFKSQLPKLDLEGTK